MVSGNRLINNRSSLKDPDRSQNVSFFQHQEFHALILTLRKQKQIRRSLFHHEMSLAFRFFLCPLAFYRELGRLHFS